MAPCKAGPARPSALSAPRGGRIPESPRDRLLSRGFCDLCPVRSPRAPRSPLSAMTSPEHVDRIVLHIAGADRPGVTARLMKIIAEDNAELVDIGPVRAARLPDALGHREHPAELARAAAYSVRGERARLALRSDPVPPADAGYVVGAVPALCVTVLVLSPTARPPRASPASWQSSP